jgi:NADH-quinone oxidoreductase subunit A
MDVIFLQDVAPLVLTLFLAAVLPAVFILLSAVLGPRKKDEAKDSPYECGLQASADLGDARTRFNVNFYLVAVSFLVFDVEVAFLFPWAVWFQNQAWAGFAVMAAFAGILTFGWWYLLRRGGLDWE